MDGSLFTGIAFHNVMHPPKIILEYVRFFFRFFPNFQTILNSKRNYTLLFFYFKCQCKCVLINNSHVDYMATGVYRTLMSGRLEPISSGLRYAMFARQSRFITERLPSYTPMFGTKAIHNIHYTYIIHICYE